MYKIYSAGKLLGRSETITLNKYNRENGCYNLATEVDAEGFVATIPTAVLDEETGEMTIVKIQEVFVFEGFQMRGTERTGSYEPIPES
jgi:hypothetical protein